MSGPVTGAIDPLTGTAVPVETRSAKANRDFLWPIPQLEIQANPGITQNPNY
ncbi:SusD family protein [compost metagenome]